MGSPNYILERGKPEVYHPINWARVGSYCGLALDQNKLFLEDAPDDAECCQSCLDAMPRVKKRVTRFKKIREENDQGTDS